MPRGSFKDLISNRHPLQMHVLPRFKQLINSCSICSSSISRTAQQASSSPRWALQDQLVLILPDPCTSRLPSTHRSFPQEVLTEAALLCLSISASTSLSPTLSIYLPLSQLSLLLPQIVPSTSGLSDLLGVPLLSISSKRNQVQLVWGR